jgi:hypothetical protein
MACCPQGGVVPERVRGDRPVLYPAANHDYTLSRWRGAAGKAQARLGELMRSRGAPGFSVINMPTRTCLIISAWSPRWTRP